MLNKPRVQNKQQIGRLRECGHNTFDSSDPLPVSLSSFGVMKRGRTSISVIGSATELEAVLDAMETGLEFRDEANELGSDGKHLDL